MDTKKIKEFVKTHKVQITLSAGAVLGTVTFVLLGKSNALSKECFSKTAKAIEDISIPKDFAVGEIVELWNEGDYTNAIVNNVTTKQLGDLGREFVNKGVVAKDADVSMIIGFTRNN